MTQGLLQDLVTLRSVPEEYRRRSYRHAFSWVFIGAFFAIVVGQGPFVIRALGGTATQSLLMNVAQGIPLVPAVLWVHFIERRNPVRLTGLFLGLGGLVMIFSGVAGGNWSLSLFLAGSLGIITLYSPIMGATLEQIYPTEWRGQLQALPNMVDMLVRIFCLLVVGWLLQYDLRTWRVIFPLAGLSMMIGASMFRGIPGSRGNPLAGGMPGSWWEHVRNSVRAAVSNRQLLVALTGYFFVTSGGVVYASALPIFANDQLHLDAGRWGIASAASLGAILVCLWFWGRFMDRFGALLTVLITWTGMGLLMAALFFVTSWPAFLVYVAAYGLFMSGNMLAFFPIVIHFARSGETMRGMGLHSTFWGIRWILMPGLVIFVVDTHLFPERYRFLIATGMVVLGLAIMGRLWRQERRRPALENA